MHFGGFPDGSEGKESACSVGDPGSIPGWGRAPGEGHDSPLQYSCLENSMDRCYNPWGHKESETTEQLTLSLFRVYFAFWINAVNEQNAFWDKMRNEVKMNFSSVQFSCSVESDSLRPRESQHARPPCPSPTPGVHSNSHPSSQWCHPAISSSVIPFSSCPQSLPASESFPMSQLFAWGGQSIGVSNKLKKLNFRGNLKFRDKKLNEIQVETTTKI